MAAAAQDNSKWVPFLWVIAAAVLAAGVNWGILQSQQNSEMQARQRLSDRFDSQAGTITEIRVSMVKMQAIQLRIEQSIGAQRRDTDERLTAARERIERVESRIKTVWPRLRAHGENIAILSRQLELLCQCKIELNQPQTF